MKRLKKWINCISKYPSSEIFFEGNSQSAKAEKRINGICEELYKFNFGENKVNVLAELRTTFRELEVLTRMGIDKCRIEYFQKVILDFEKASKQAICALDNMHKKDPILQAYYSEFKMSTSDVEEVLKDITYSYVKRYSLGK